MCILIANLGETSDSLPPHRSRDAFGSRLCRNPSRSRVESMYFNIASVSQSQADLFRSLASVFSLSLFERYILYDHIENREDHLLILLCKCYCKYAGCVRLNNDTNAHHAILSRREWISAARNRLRRKVEENPDDSCETDDSQRTALSSRQKTADVRWPGMCAKFRNVPDPRRVENPRGIFRASLDSAKNDAVIPSF